MSDLVYDRVIYVNRVVNIKNISIIYHILILVLTLSFKYKLKQYLHTHTHTRLVFKI